MKRDWNHKSRLKVQYTEQIKQFEGLIVESKAISEIKTPLISRIGEISPRFLLVHSQDFWLPEDGSFNIPPLTILTKII